MQLDPNKPTIILATSNGVGMGHLARASAISMYAREWSNVIIVSMASGVAMIPTAMGLLVEYIPGRDRNLMPRKNWDKYLADRLVALIDETKAVLLTFDGVIPYPGILATKSARPAVKLVWIRRGLWQEKPHRHLLGVHSKLMDFVIEPGDYAREYDAGPTADRTDAKLTSPVSLYQETEIIPKKEAENILDLDPSRPAMLLQLGTGDADVNEKMRVVLEELSHWRDLQVVMTKAPMDSDGQSLAPKNLDIKVVKYFPLANLLSAFDGAIAAAGYNSVHELLPAKVPTLFIPNIRGTDNQAARARWCADAGISLYADQENLEDIREKVHKLIDPDTRRKLRENCLTLSSPEGNEEASKLLQSVIKMSSNDIQFQLRYISYSLQRNLTKKMRSLLISVIRKMSQVYNYLKKRDPTEGKKEEIIIKFSTSIDQKYLLKEISKFQGFEHILMHASSSYRKSRIQIAAAAYGQGLDSTTFESLMNEYHETIIERSGI